MTKRKKLSNNIRFEVFKRDSFTCQYCGKKSPTVVLNVDHIEPVSKGGSNDLFNLITSCFECNNGKRDKRLNDGEVLTRQHIELEEVNERRKQIELMLKWKKELKKFELDQVQHLAEYIGISLMTSITDVGKDLLKDWLKKHTFEELVEATDKALDIYSGRPRGLIFSKIERIAYYTKNPVAEHVKKANYMFGVFRNRDFDFNETKIHQWMKRFSELNGDLDEAVELAKSTDDWMEFEELMEFLIAEREYEIDKEKEQ